MFTVYFISSSFRFHLFYKYVFFCLFFFFNYILIPVNFSNVFEILLSFCISFNCNWVEKVVCRSADAVIIGLSKSSKPSIILRPSPTSSPHPFGPALLYIVVVGEFIFVSHFHFSHSPAYKFSFWPMYPKLRQ